MEADRQQDNAGAWEHFPHESDVGIRGFGPTLADAFAQVGIAMTATITTPATVQARTAVPIRCEAAEPSLLLLDWVNAVIYEMATRRMLFSRYDVRIDGATLRVMAWGEPVDRGRLHPPPSPKLQPFWTSPYGMAPMVPGSPNA